MVTAAVASRKKLSIVSATSESVDNRVVSVDRPMTAGLGTLTVSDFFSNNNNKKRLFVYIVVYLFVHLFTCVFVYYQPHITTTDWIFMKIIPEMYVSLDREEAIAFWKSYSALLDLFYVPFV